MPDASYAQPASPTSTTYYTNNVETPSLLAGGPGNCYRATFCVLGAARLAGSHYNEVVELFQSTEF